ncbi:hypothetical protein EMIT0P265_270011 [Pseudomonas zeae]
MGRVAVVTQPTAQHSMRGRRPWRPKRTLLRGSERFDSVIHMLRGRLSPEQIADKLRSMNMPSLKDAYVCRETIYNAIYALPVGGASSVLVVPDSSSAFHRALLAAVRAGRYKCTSSA